MYQVDIRPYYQKREELSTQDGCVLWGSRVVVPSQGQARVLELLHDCHSGISRMKSLARSVVWWPGIDKDIEAKVKDCYSCQQNQRAPSRAPLHPWDWPRKPWTRLHIDHAGPFLGKMFFLLIDAHSKWLEVRTVPTANSHFTIQALRSIFATHGLPEVLVSDNGTAFTSAEFREFVSLNGI